jgi:hypothetical protein
MLNIPLRNLCALFSFGELHFSGNSLIGPKDLNFHFVPGFVRAQSVSEIIQVLYLVVTEFDENVAGF